MTKQTYPHDGGEAYLRDYNLHGDALPVREENIADYARQMDRELPDSTTMAKAEWVAAKLKEFPEHRRPSAKPRKEIAKLLTAKGRLDLANGNPPQKGAELRKISK